MPWNSQGGGGNGGGPWGGGGQGGGGGGGNPWGRPPGGGGGPTGRGSGPTPPDFEQIIRKGQDRFKQAMPGGFGGGRLLWLVVIGAVIVWLLTGIYRVEPDEVGVELRFGEYIGETPAGLHYHLPAPIESVITPSVTTVNRIEIGFRGTDGRSAANRDVPDESLMLTGDENIVSIDFTVLWKIDQIDGGVRDFLFNIRDPETTVKIVAESAMREIIANTPIQTALTLGREDIELAVQNNMQVLLDEYAAGIDILEVKLQEVDPPPEVVDAFNDVLRSRQDRERLSNQAEAYRNQILPEARGAAVRMTQEAEAYRAQIVADAVGDTQRFLAVLRSYQAAPDVTARRFYLEALEEVLAKTDVVLIDQGEGGQDVVPYLPLNELMRRTEEADR